MTDTDHRLCELMLVGLAEHGDDISQRLKRDRIVLTMHLLGHKRSFDVWRFCNVKIADDATELLPKLQGMNDEMGCDLKGKYHIPRCRGWLSILKYHAVWFNDIIKYPMHWQGALDSGLFSPVDDSPERCKSLTD